MGLNRNDICNCGSGKKYKKCCLLKPKPVSLSHIVNKNSLQKLSTHRIIGHVRYVFTGHLDKEGKRYMADVDCDCGGRGYQGEDLKHHVLAPCRCLKLSPVSVDWLLLPKKSLLKEHKVSNG